MTDLLCYHHRHTSIRGCPYEVSRELGVSFSELEFGAGGYTVPGQKPGLAHGADCAVFGALGGSMSMRLRGMGADPGGSLSLDGDPGDGGGAALCEQRETVPGPQSGCQGGDQFPAPHGGRAGHLLALSDTEGNYVSTSLGDRRQRRIRRLPRVFPRRHRRRI